MIKARFLTPLILLGLLSGCEHFAKQEPGVGKAIAFDDLPGWHQDQHAEALIALRKGCARLKKKPEWATICQATVGLGAADHAKAKQFFETYFTPHVLVGEKGKKEGLITGYYEPLLHGAMQADDRYRYPLYRPPDDMLIVELASLYPELKGKRVRGRLVGNRIVPYYARAEIENGKQPLQGQELLWVDDRDQLFFLQIQGSGRVELPDGQVIGAAYANQNGHAYVSIGKRLIEMGELKREEVSLFTIKSWLKNNPSRAKSLLNENPSYVFFTLNRNVDEGPRGSLNVPLTAERSLAIDPKFIDLGSPIWLSTTYPDDDKHKLQKLLIAQDTGGAIKGQLRADIFWGAGKHAETMAGNMKQSGKMFVLLPKTSHLSLNQ